MQGDQKVSVHLMVTVQKTFISILFIFYYIFIIVIQLIEISSTQFGVLINVWRLAKDLLITQCVAHRENGVPSFQIPTIYPVERPATWSIGQFLITDHEVPCSIPGFTMGIFL
jgi:hypothetical protein